MPVRFRRSSALRISLGSVACCAVGAATLGTLRPAVANALVARVDAIVTCATSDACIAAANSKNGAGVFGSSTAGAGVQGTSSSGDGVVASSTTGRGVYASSAKGNGVTGLGNTFGVVGATGGQAMFPANNAGGVWGFGPSIGVLGTTSGTGYGVYGVKGLTTSGTGVLGEASADGVGTRGESHSGLGVYASSVTGTALRAYSTGGTGLRSDIAGGGFSVVGTSVNGAGAGADFEGGRYGIVGRAQPTGFPLVLTDSSYHNIFYVSGTGDIYYSGNFYSFARTGSGSIVSSFTPASTEPTVEDAGSAKLVMGVATVALDRTFAVARDPNATYRVFLTPDGDTRGLYVARKSSRDFVVREIQGGRSNLAFDYRILATSRGGRGKRMAFARLGDAPRPPGALPAATSAGTSR